MISPMQSTGLTDAVFDAVRENVLRLTEGGAFRHSFPLGLDVLRRDAVSISNHCFEEPLVGLTLQGRKVIRVGQTDTVLTAGIVLVTCIDAPCASTVIEATPDDPYLSVYLKLDRRIMADLLINGAWASDASASPEKFWAAPADLEMLDAFRRLLAALERRADAQLVQLIVRELHCLVLDAPQSGLLRQLYAAGCMDNRITGVIVWMRANLQEPASMERMAKLAHMSVSTFHRHFKRITGISPLQYHKQLRLHEAQRLMLAHNQHASEAALAVGYESVTQFNREYRRLFGEPPGRDIANRRKKFSFPDSGKKATW